MFSNTMKAFNRPPILIDPSILKIEIDPLVGINLHWEKLGGSPGKAVSGLEQAGAGHRVRYEHGAIYEKADDGSTAWVYGAIGEKYDALGGAQSWLGLPMSDEAPFTEGGRVSSFEHGAIYWWPDTGAIELNDVVVHYTGIVCFGETDSDQSFSDSDEPYVILGVVTPTGNSANRSPIYEDVDGGESRPDLIEVYRGKPYGIVIDSLLMEYDEGDPDKYKAAVASAVSEGSKVVTKLVGKVPYVGPPLAVVLDTVLSELAPTITNELNNLLGTDDDQLGNWACTITAKQMVVLAARTNNSVEQGVGFKLSSPLISRDGASYKVYFGLVPG